MLFGHGQRSAGVPGRLVPVLKSLFYDRTAVTIFFVISGFLISTLLAEEKSARGDIDVFKFYARRFLRIVPVCYAYIAFIWLMNAEFGLGIRRSEFLPALTYTANFVSGCWLLGHMWSLGVEEQFYLFWPWVSRIPARAIAMTTVLLLALSPICRYVEHFSPGAVVNMAAPFLRYSDALMMGCLASFVRRHKPHWPERGLLRSKAFFAFCVLAVWANGFLNSWGWGNVWFGVFGDTLLSAAVAFIVLHAVALKEGAVYRFLNHPFMIYIGGLSYSLYIWQQYFLAPRMHGGHDFWWRTFPLNFILAYLAAMVSYHLWEKQFLRLKDRFRAEST